MVHLQQLITRRRFDRSTPFSVCAILGHRTHRTFHHHSNYPKSRGFAGVVSVRESISRLVRLRALITRRRFDRSTPFSVCAILGHRTYRTLRHYSNYPKSRGFAGVVSVRESISRLVRLRALITRRRFDRSTQFSVCAILEHRTYRTLRHHSNYLKSRGFAGVVSVRESISRLVRLRALITRRRFDRSTPFSVCAILGHRTYRTLRHHSNYPKSRGFAGDGLGQRVYGR